MAGEESANVEGCLKCFGKLEDGNEAALSFSPYFLMFSWSAIPNAANQNIPIEF
jgi:hypothetical protein